MTLLTFFATSALAAAVPQLDSVPAWAWKPGEVSRWHLETEMFIPRGHFVAGMVNIQGRAGRIKLVADTECTAAAEGKNTALTCTFAYVGLSGDGVSLPADEQVPAVLTEWSAMLAPTKVVMVQGPEGRIRSFDLQNTKRSSSKAGEIIEQQRVMLQRLFCLFELPLPTTIDDFKRGWKVSSTSALMQLVSAAGTGGGYDLAFTAGPVSDGLLPIDTYGTGTLSYGSALDASTGTRMLKAIVSTKAAFDLKKGRTVWRGMTFDTRLTVASNDAGSDVEFYQVSAIQEVDSFLPNGATPLSLMASRAPKRALPEPELSAGLSLVPFASLGMQPLFLPAMPTSGKQLGLPTTTLTARVEVDAAGRVTQASVFKGYEALVSACELALKGAQFSKLDKPYAVDVEVEFRAGAQ